MLNSLWKVGFYFNSFLFFFSSFTWVTLFSFYGLGLTFIYNLFLRSPNPLNYLKKNKCLTKLLINIKDLELLLVTKKTIQFISYSNYNPFYLVNYSFFLLKLTVNYIASFRFLYTTLLNQYYKNQQSLEMRKIFKKNEFSLNFKFIFIYLIFSTYPVLLNTQSQVNFNFVFFFLTRTVRGLSFKLGKPIYSKTRSKTYYTAHWTKPKNTHKKVFLRLNWF